MSSYYGEKISVVRKTKGRLPSLPFENLKDIILGKKYELSIVFLSAGDSRILNNDYRNKNYATNILSFPVSETAGDIFINLEKVRKDAPLFEKSYPDFLLQILIHGMVHLKGLDHGKEMDLLEEKYFKKFFDKNKKMLY